MLPTTVVVVLLGLVVTHETIGQNSFPRDLQAAERGDWGAIIAVGHDYMYGNGTDKNWERAEYWFRRLPFSLTMSANEQTYADQAFVSLGVIYMNGGWGVAKNPTYARYYLERIDPNGIHGDERQRFLKNLNDSQQTNASSAATTSNTVKTQATYGQSGGQNAASQGTCAVVYEAQTEHTEMYGTYLTYGAAWGRATIGEAQNAARADMFRSLGNTPLNHTLLGANSDGIVTDASGCGHDHGAVAVALKETFIDGRLHTFGNVVFEQVDAALADSTEAASAQAIAACKAEYNGSYQDFLNCHVVVRW